jgi:ubiquinone/menaquinone biosynthesis C-methylase UbiE
MSSQAAQQPTPQLFFQTLNSYQLTEALKAAIELETFSVIAEGKTTVTAIAQATQASERGTRILCDFLCLMGFLTKENGNYQLTRDSALFLDKRSPAYLGGVTKFLLTPTLVDAFKDLTAAVRKGGTTISEEGTVAPDHPIWVEFARSMAPMMAMPAQSLARLVDPSGNQPLRILDIAAGHGLYGLAFAQNNPQAEVVAVDWPNVLSVAQENAERMGVANRFSKLPGSAFEVDYGTGYDLALLTNFLHHFDTNTCEALLRKINAALKEGGRVATVEFVPNDDRISPPEAAGFSLMMLGSTPAGDAYTFTELERMFAAAGFARSEIFPLQPSIESVVVSYK